MYTVARGRAPRCDYIDKAIFLGGFPGFVHNPQEEGHGEVKKNLVEINVSKNILALIVKQVKELTANMSPDLASSFRC